MESKSVSGSGDSLCEFLVVRGESTYGLFGGTELFLPPGL